METNQNQLLQSQLAEIVQGIGKSIGGEEAVILAVSGIRKLLHAEACAVSLLSEEDPEIMRVIRQSKDGGPEISFIPVIQHPVASSWGDGGASEISMPNPLTQIVQVDGSRASEVVSRRIMVPLIVQNQRIGLLEVDTLSDNGIEVPQFLSLLAPFLAFSILSGNHIRQQTIENADLEARCWEIRREQSILSHVFDGLPFPLYCIDQHFRLVSVNTYAAERSNSESHLLLGMRCYEALYQRAEPCPGCRAGESLTSGIMTFRTGRNWQVDGDPREWEISTYSLKDDHGQVVEAVVLEQDATEKNRLVESLARTAKLAAVEQLAAGVAHEINNPLVAIIANSQLLQRELEPDNTMLESIDLIAQAGDRALGVVRALLDLAQQDTYNFKLTDINQSIRSAVHLVKPRLMDGSVELDLFLSPELPLIQASQNHLQGMWLNLLFNARDALDENQGRITISSKQQGNYILVYIQDDGIGIPEERLEHIFDRFYKAL